MSSIPNDDMTIPRSLMPQIDEKYYPDLLVFLGARGVAFKAGFINPQLVFAHQAVDVEHAMALDAMKLAKPVLLSSDPAVLDGDHRWYNHLMNKTHMPFIQLDCDFHTALSHLFTYPKVYEVDERNNPVAQAA